MAYACSPWQHCISVSNAHRQLEAIFTQILAGKAALQQSSTPQLASCIWPTKCLSHILLFKHAPCLSYNLCGTFVAGGAWLYAHSTPCQRMRMHDWVPGLTDPALGITSPTTMHDTSTTIVDMAARQRHCYVQTCPRMSDCSVLAGCVPCMLCCVLSSGASRHDLVQQPSGRMAHPVDNTCGTRAAM
jgi:hypothetical protein